MRDHVLGLIRRHLPGPFNNTGSGNVVTRCPFHKDGHERKSSFSINLDKALFQCFTCKLTGDITYLLRLLGLPRTRIEAEVAVIRPYLDQQRELRRIEQQNFFVGRDPFKAEHVLPETLLGVYDWLPTKLVEDGFDGGLLRDHEVGYDCKNLRITYPIRDLYGNLAGISGGATLPTQQPKYKVYQGGRKLENGRWHEGDFGEWFDDNFPHYTCENRNHLWNFHRVMARMESPSEAPAILYLVEGFKAALWLIQNGYPDTVALMGSTISETQQRMLHRLGITVVLFLDNDEAGRRGTILVGDKLWRPLYGRLRVAAYPAADRWEDTQPDSYLPEGVHHILSGAVPYLPYRNEALRSQPSLRAYIEKRKITPW